MTGSFHLAKCPDGSCKLWHVSESPPLLKAEYNSTMDIPHFLYPLIHQWALFSILWLLWIMLLRTRMYRYLSPQFHYFKKNSLQKKSAVNFLSKRERGDQEQHSVELQESRRQREAGLTLTLCDPDGGASENRAPRVSSSLSSPASWTDGAERSLAEHAGQGDSLASQPRLPRLI